MAALSAVLPNPRLGLRVENLSLDIYHRSGDDRSLALQVDRDHSSWYAAIQTDGYGLEAPFVLVRRILDDMPGGLP